MTRRSLPLLCLCFFLSGFGSLILEVVWTRQLRLIFGSTTLAASTILVAYMLGLGIGGLIGGRTARRLRNGIGTYGAIEIAIGLVALAVPFLLAALPPLARALVLDLGPWGLVLGRFVVALLVLLVLAIRYQSSTYFEAALLLAMVGFVGTIAYCKFILRGDIVE